MRRSIWITGVVASLLVLLALETAQAQVYVGVGRGYGGYGGYGYRGYGYGGYGYGGYGYRGWAGRPYYGGYYRSYGGWTPGYGYSYPYVYGYPNYGYGAYPYTSSYFYYGSPQVYSPSYPLTYSSGIVTASDQSTERRSFYSGGQDLGNKALLKVQVPKSDARLWVQGQEMQQDSGQERSFLSPPLEPGKKYEYTVRASWMANGQEVSRERKVAVESGQQVAVFFREGDDSGTGAPEPGRTLRPNDLNTRPGDKPNLPPNPSDDTNVPRPTGNPSNRPPL